MAMKVKCVYTQKVSEAPDYYGKQVVGSGYWTLVSARSAKAAVVVEDSQEG